MCRINSSNRNFTRSFTWIPYHFSRFGIKHFHGQCMAGSLSLKIGDSSLWMASDRWSSAAMCDGFAYRNSAVRPPECRLTPPKKNRTAIYSFDKFQLWRRFSTFFVVFDSLSNGRRTVCNVGIIVRFVLTHQVQENTYQQVERPGV